MRIRNFRQEDIPTLMYIERMAAKEDKRAVNSEDFAVWLTDPMLDARSNAFVITDDDDELNPWSQAGTLDGIEGEIVGYITVQLQQEERSYHFICLGTVHPQYRRQNAGRALLICALNRARIIAAEFEFEAEQKGLPIYFEALFPINDTSVERLAGKCEMQPIDAPAPVGTCWYRRLLE